MAIDDIKHYIKSIIAMRDGKTEAAESELAQSLNVNSLPAYTKENMGKLLDANNPSDAMLTIISKER
jgi:hypothetical protein